MSAVTADIDGTIHKTASANANATICSAGSNNGICRFLPSGISSTLKASQDNSVTTLATGVIVAVFSHQSNGIRKQKTITVRGTFEPSLENANYIVTVVPAPVASYAAPSDLRLPNKHVCVQIRIRTPDTGFQGSSIYCPQRSMLKTPPDYDGASLDMSENETTERPILVYNTSGGKLTSVTYTVRGASFAFGSPDNSGYRPFTGPPTMNLLLTERRY